MIKWKLEWINVKYDYNILTKGNSYPSDTYNNDLIMIY